MLIAIVAGGVGGSRFVRGVREAYPQAQLRVVVNTADDITLHGLRICPDLDTIMYALGGAADPARGWGRSDESWQAMGELAAYAEVDPGLEPPWFSLGDRDLGTHLLRTQLLAAGRPLSEVTRRLCVRWLAGRPGIRLLPMTDDAVETHIAIEDADGRREIHFQEYWVRRHAEPEALGVRLAGIDAAVPGPGVLEAFATADLILLAPSNPVVSVGPVLAVSGVREAVRTAPAPVVGFSPILRGAPVLGMAHRLLPALGIEVGAAAVGCHYGARPDGVLDVWAIDDGDAAEADRVSAAGLRPVVTDLVMRDPQATAAFVHRAVEAARW